MPTCAEDWSAALNIYGPPTSDITDAFPRVSQALTAHLAADPEGRGDITLNAADLARAVAALLWEASSLESQLQYGDEYR